LPIVAAWSSIVVLTASLIGSKYLLDAVVDFGWPVAVYVALLAAVGYGPSLWWCRFVSRRWGTGRLGHDIGLTPRFADLGWGPVVWLGAIGAQIAVGAVVLALDIPVASNTEGISEVSADRTYVWALVISAVIAAPLVEEMVFRGVVLRGLRSRLPVVAAVILQGVLFGAAHADPVRGVGNVGLVMVLSGVGIAFGVAATLLRRIGPSIVAHAIFNGAVLALLLTGVTDRLQEEASVGEQIGVVDQAHVADASGHGDPDLPGVPAGAVERLERGERGSVEHGHVVEVRERLVADHADGGGDHVGRRGLHQ
jgi:membrane protease YdiL (CAAX protease family)